MAAIEDGAVVRAIATDGRSVALLAESSGDVHERSFPYEALPDHESAIGQLHRDLLDRSVVDDGAERERIESWIVSNREDVEAAVADRLEELLETAVDVESRSDSVGPPAVAASRAAVDEFLDELRSGDPDGSPRTSDLADAVERPGPGSASPAGENSTDGSTQAPAARTEATGDGEYVARFFGGSSSVGAVGTGSPQGTIASAVRYLLENHDLASSIRLPWPEDASEPILTDDPSGTGWIELQAAGDQPWYVRRIDDEGIGRTAIEKLADAAGLRVMFQGDWES